MLPRALTLTAVLVIVGCAERREHRAPPPDPTTETTPVTRRAQGNAIEYTLRFDGAHNHYVDVEMTAPTRGKATVDLVMAVWTPGSYLVREYSRHLEALIVTAAGDPAPLAVRKTRKNRWTVTTNGAARLAVRYRIYGREPTVRTNFFDDEIAVVIGAATFLTVSDQLESPHDVLVVPRSGWARSETGMPRHPGGSPHHYLAADFDELVDSPLVVGNPVRSEFDIDGKKHWLATFGHGAAWDADKSAKDVEALSREQLRFWGPAPYESYIYLNALIIRGRNGLEHKNSTLLFADPWLMTDDARYRGWLGLVSHEFFHTWNGKRLRPQALGPFDYENEVYTRSLWIVEGLTSYYDDLLLARAQITTEAQYINAIGSQISSVQRTGGRRVRSLSTASFDAWIKYYRPDENSQNTSVSYYTKGAVVGFLLDAQIRIATGSKRSLDDVMRTAYQRHSGERGFLPDEFRAIVNEVAGADLGGFLAAAVDGTGELDYQPALDFYGLRFKPVKPAKADARGTSLGVRASGEGRTMIRRVERDTPAYAAGLNVGDEIIAIDGARIPSSGLAAALKRLKPGAKVEVTIARRGRLRAIEVTLAAPTTKPFELERAPSRTAAQAGRFASLLAPSRVP